MIKIYNNPNNKKNQDLKFHNDCSPLLEEVERQVQMAINIFDEICHDENTLVANPTVNGAIDLLEKKQKSCQKEYHIEKHWPDKNLL